MRSECTCILISDFTIDNLAGYLKNDKDVPKVKSIVSPYNQVFRVMVDEKLECWKHNLDVAIVWTQPESVIESFSHILNFRNISIEDIFEEVDRFSSLLLNVCDRAKYVFVPIWVSPSYNRGFGMLDMKTGIGIENTLMRMNLRLTENLEKASNIYLLNTRKWIESAGKSAFSPKLWYMAKIPFGNQVFMEATRDLKSALRGIAGDSKKLIILDLDDTLWGDIVGDVGWENIQLGGHDHIGEAHVDFQCALKSMTNRGVLLGIVSKNEEDTALEAIEKHPEMVLKLDDFAGWRINWDDKAKNICDLVADLNLGTESVVFIDDNPIERARVRDMLPEIYVPEWPQDKTLYKSALLSIPYFDSPSISKEDSERTKMYVSRRKSESLKRKVGSLDEWLKSLETKVRGEELNEGNLQRTFQLLNKTNQMNLTTRRMTEAELVNWCEHKNHNLWTFRVSDKLVDSGLTGIVSLEQKGSIGRIVDFVLSCRIMGRKVEEAILYTVIKYGQCVGLSEIQAKYIRTSKNKPCLEFWRKSGFMYNETSDLFSWETSNPYSFPECIEIGGSLYEK